MIDAFEIGVALALPEGVAAGMVAVRKAMRAVDSAVAAGGAGLVALVEASARAASTGAEERGPEEAAGPDGLETAGDESVPVRRELGSIGADPVRTVMRGIAAERPLAAPPTGEMESTRGGAAAAPDLAAQARLFARGIVDLGMGVRVPDATLDAAAGAVLAISSDQGDAASGDERIRLPGQPGLGGASARVSGGLGSAPGASSDLREERLIEQVVASLGGVDGAAASDARIGADLTRVRAGWRGVQGHAKGAGWDTAEALRAGAPLERGEETATPSRAATGLFSERAAAPRVENEGGDGGGGGIVMLDGRLVGQWLSDRMARDAARPGAGTTGFDPRQAPAWTPSGVP